MNNMKMMKLNYCLNQGRDLDSPMINLITKKNSIVASDKMKNLSIKLKFKVKIISTLQSNRKVKCFLIKKMIMLMEVVYLKTTL